MSVIKKIIIALLVLLLLLTGTAFGLFQYYYGNTNYLDDSLMEYGAYEGGHAPVEELELQEVKGNEGSYYNILLIGTDLRETEAKWNGNSDVMMLVTLNEYTNTLYMTSFMRDLYADIPGYGVHKLNYSYARGGAGLLMETIRGNYGVDIDNYATVDFSGMTNIIDIVGGVDIEIMDYELEWAKQNGVTVNGNMAHLNGEQAVGYQRIRYIGRYDFERTARQRRVVQAILTKARSMNIPDVLKMADEILPLVTHNVDQATTMKLMARIPTVLKYNVVECRVPYDDNYHTSDEILIPNSMTDTINALRDTIYATEKSAE